MYSTREPYTEKPGREQKRTSLSFILGILSLIFLIVSPQVISLVLSIIGLVIGAKDRKNDAECIYGEAGWIMSLIGVVLSSLMIILGLIIMIVLIVASVPYMH